MFNKLKTCRCCLQQDEDKNGMYEFSSEVSVDNEIREDATFVKISECFTVITGITISEELEDSSKICSRCLGDLKFCYQFRRKCAESEYAYNGCNEIEPQGELNSRNSKVAQKKNGLSLCSFSLGAVQVLHGHFYHPSS